MSIESELVSFLENNIKNEANKLRDIEIIKFYYGLNDFPWPTLEETAERFSINSRERIRQILKFKFRQKVSKNSIPSLYSFINLLHSREYWQLSEFTEQVYMKGLSESHHIKGIFNLISDIDIECDFEFYTNDLIVATRSSIISGKDVFLIKASNIKDIQRLLKKAQSLPGRCGIANLKYIKEELGDNFNLILLLIRSSDNSWVKVDGDDYWYIFENRANTIINYCEKVFGIFDDCDSYKLATVFKNALNSRSHKYPYPPIEIINDYLKSSVFLINTEMGLKFIVDKNEKLNKIEEELLSFFRVNSQASFPEIRQYLEKKGYEHAHIVKSVNHSPFIYIDKSLGRQHYIYSFIEPRSLILDENKDIDLYEKYVLRLRSLHDVGTDDIREQMVRKEQHILQEWLFKDKTHENCALCGQEFSINTLVTAHKKPRANCNNAERLDPYIVMPICLMGCDYLYEHMYIYIDESEIKRGLDFPHAKMESGYIEKLIGRTIDTKWLLGNKSFFRSPKDIK
jgi:hypothetical protein